MKQQRLSSFLVLLIASLSVVHGKINTYERSFDLQATCDNNPNIVVLLQCDLRLRAGDTRSGSVCDISLCNSDLSSNPDSDSIESDCFETIEDIDPLRVDINRINRDSNDAGDSSDNDPLFDYSFDEDFETDLFEDVGYDYFDGEYFIVFKEEFDETTGERVLVDVEAEITCEDIEQDENTPITVVNGGSEQRTIICTDLHDWTDSFGDTCRWYKDHDEPGCPVYGAFYIPENGIAPRFACCYCQQIGEEAGQRTTPSCYNIVDWEDRDGDGCDWYEQNDDLGCPRYGGRFTQLREGDPFYEISSQEACCYCRTTSPISV